MASRFMSTNPVTSNVLDHEAREIIKAINVALKSKRQPAG
jgi:hypothetical protein